MVPIGVVLVMGYLNFATCYALGYQEIYRHHSRAVAISFWCLLAVFQVLLVVYWVVLWAKGPGKVTQIGPYDLYGTSGPSTSGPSTSGPEGGRGAMDETASAKDETASAKDETASAKDEATEGNGPTGGARASTKEESGARDGSSGANASTTPAPFGASGAPEYFFCDSHGFPIWCSNCQTIKPPRSCHMSGTGTCVPRADHFCLWVGSVIGQNNYIVFMKFMVWYWCYFVVVLVYLGVFGGKNIQRNGGSGMNHNYIVLFVVSGFWVVAITALLGSHLFYIGKNITTIDDMAMGRAKRAKARSGASRPGASQDGRGRLDKDIRGPGDFGRGNKEQGQDKDGQNGSKEASSSDGAGQGQASSLGIRFINIKHGNLRLVVQCSVFDHFNNFGPKRNFINVFYYNTSSYFPPDEKYYTTGKFVMSVVLFLVPLVDLFHTASLGEEVSLSPKFEEYLRGKIERRRCYLPLYGAMAPAMVPGPVTRGTGTVGTRASAEQPTSTSSSSARSSTRLVPEVAPVVEL